MAMADILLLVGLAGFLFQGAEGVQPVRECDVIVIGGGGAGAHFSVFVADNDYQVCLIEISDKLGGACTTREFSPPVGSTSHIELGFLLMHNTTKNNERGFGQYTVDMAQHFSRFGEIEAFPPFGSKTTHTMDLENNLGITENPSVPPEIAQATITALAQYLNTVYPELEEARNPANLSSVLTQSIVDLFDNDPFLKNFGVLLASTLQSSGIVPLNNQSAWAGLRGNVPSFLMGFIEEGWLFTMKHGCRAIYDNITNHLQNVTNQNVFLNANVTKVTRPKGASSNGNVMVHFRINNEGPEHHIIGKRLVIAIPPTLENLWFMDLQPEEIALFQHITVSPGYYGVQLEVQENVTLLSNSKTTNAANYGEVNFDFAPISTFLCDFGNLGPCHGFAVALHTTTQGEMEARITDQLELMSVLPNPVNMTLTEVVEHKNYFGHVKFASLQQDPTLYGQLERRQGELNTYFIGSTFSHADRTLAIEYANLVAQDAFPPASRRMERREPEAITTHQNPIKKLIRMMALH